MRQEGERLSTIYSNEMKGEQMPEQTKRNKTPKPDKQAYESSQEDRRNEKLVYKFITLLAYEDLEQHLKAKANEFNLLKVYNNAGYSPVIQAAYKNQEKVLKILIDFVLSHYGELTPEEMSD